MTTAPRSRDGGSCRNATRRRDDSLSRGHDSMKLLRSARTAARIRVARPRRPSRIDCGRAADVAEGRHVRSQAGCCRPGGRNARSPARAHRPLPRPAARADAALRRESRQGGGAQRWLPSQTLKGTELQDAARGRLRTELRRARAVSAGREDDGRAAGLDDADSARRSPPIARPSSPASSACETRRRMPAS